MDLDKAESSLKSMAHSEQHYFNRWVELHVQIPIFRPRPPNLPSHIEMRLGSGLA